jgi:hypothetical protein
MSSKPILFNTEMVKAILDGRKTQFRKVIVTDFMNIEIEKDVMPQEVKFLDFKRYCPQLNFKDNGNAVFQLINRTRKPLPFCDGVARHIDVKPKYKVGDALYVRETFNLNGDCWGVAYPLKINYKADSKENGFKWISSNIMRKEYARIFLKVTNVRVERLQEAELQDICEEGYPEGYQPFYFTSDLKRELHENKMDDWWINLWNSTAKDGYKYLDNPYVFVYEFERIEKQ